MKPAPFTYHRPSSLDDALGLLAKHGDDCSPLAGGQSLVPMLNMRLGRPEHLVDLNALDELDFVKVDDEAIEIGSMVRHHRLATDPVIRKAVPMLAHVAGTIGHYAIRQRGTIGGSLVQADPAGQLPLIAILLDAEIIIRSAKGERSVAARDFLVFSMEVALEENELVTAVRFPALSRETLWSFEMFSRRRGDYAQASVGLAFDFSEGSIGGMRIAVGATAPLPHRLTKIEDTSLGASPDEAWIREFAQAGAEAAEVEDTPQAPAAYKRELVATLTERALGNALSGRST